jgi:hypothetical protein
MYKSDAVFSDVSDIRSVYVKDNSRSDQFSLQNGDARGTTAEAFAAELNGQGAEAIAIWVPRSSTTSCSACMPSAMTASPTTYQVDKLTSASSAADAAAMRTRLAQRVRTAGSSAARRGWAATR